MSADAPVASDEGAPASAGTPSEAASASAGELPGATAAALAPPVAEESEAQKQARLRRMRQHGGGLGYEPEAIPPPPREEPPADVAAEPAPAPSRRFAAPFAQAPAEPSPVEDDDARFRPPVAHLDDDARFAPPAAHRIASAGSMPSGLAAVVDRPTRPLGEEVPLILGYPAGKFGLFVVSSGALLLFLLQVLVGGRIGTIVLPKLTLAMVPVAILPVLMYISSYLVCVTESACQGKEDLPGWPDLGLAGGLGWRMFLAYVAAFAPALLVLCLLLRGGPDRGQFATIGPQAMQLAGSTALVPPGTSAKDAEFVTLDGGPTVLSGKWTIVGLLGKDTVDDTGTDEALASMPSAGFGVVIDHLAQIHDLDRVGRALEGKVNVVAAYADPGCKIVWGRHPYAVPQSVRDARGWGRSLDEGGGFDEGGGLDEGGGFDEGGDDLGEFDTSDETQEALRRAQGAAARGAVAQGAPARRPEDPANNPFKTVQFVRTEQFVFPAPFDKVKGLPAVYVLDPQGVVRHEFATGVHDEQLYGAVLDLMAGGDGDALPTELPPSAYGLSDSGAGPLRLLGGGALLLAILFAALYLPMAVLLTVSFTDGWMAFQYPAGLKAIAVGFKDYVVVAGLCLGAGVVGVLLKLMMSVTIARALPSSIAWIPRDYLNHWIWFYGALVSSYAVGRFYYRNRDAIGWFSRR